MRTLPHDESATVSVLRRPRGQVLLHDLLGMPGIAVVATRGMERVGDR